MPINEDRRATEKAHKHARWAKSPPAAADALGLTPDDIAALERSMIGIVAVAGDDRYKLDEQSWNKAFDEKPALIAYCEVDQDVGACLAFAQKHALDFTCRSGGHSTAAYCLNNGGLVIDVSLMNGVFVDAARKQAVVQAGTLFGKLNAVLDPYGLHVPGGGCPDVGVGGYMQGGGYGWTCRMFGIHSDNVLSLRMMLADGTIVTANSTEHRDLYWAVRGGTGNNFGVLLDATYQLHDLPSVWAWGLRWEMKEGAMALHELQKGFMLTNDDRTLGFQGAITTNEGEQAVMMRGMVNGDREAGLEAIAGMRKIGNPKLQVDGEGSYMEWDDGLLDGVPPITMTKDGFPLKEDKFSVYLGRVLEVDEWQEVLDFFATAPNPGNTIGMEIGGGAVAAYPKDGSAYIHRDVYCDFFVDSFWYDPKDEDAAKQWVLDFRAIMEKYWNGHSYQNYPRRDNVDYRYMYFGEAFNTLLDVKKRYDPDNVFRFPQGITPVPDDAPDSVRRPEAPSLFAGE